ncbi:MAG: GguC family protein [Erythrobacter sp.]|uniref:AraD1 family protein n=1 Tax=Erythrobacter sp. TaxID=1042 RepID=UPI00261BC1A5|nr:AraD1 family protein [Erythrobacter sp.]MDJ0977300.1 GguC family protein [Erythrobacter sp.]
MLLVQFTSDQDQPVCGLLDPITDQVRTHTEGLSTFTFINAIMATSGTSLKDASHHFQGAILKAENLAQEQRLLPPITHPDPYRCLVSGTGLTHKGSAETRDQMHASAAAEAETDTARLFQWGLEGGAATSKPGTPPEWFYKGDGASVVAPGAALVSPAFGQGPGEEPELAMIYLVDANGQPQRIGSALGNEFSDHTIEKQNYLYLAHSKLRPCSIGPALRLGLPPRDIHGTARIVRHGAPVWQRSFATGEANMTHSLGNLEHHHFKYERHCRPGDLHIHFLGTAVLSFADGVELTDGDVMEIGAPDYGSPLSNPVVIEPANATVVHVGEL